MHRARLFMVCFLCVLPATPSLAFQGVGGGTGPGGGTGGGGSGGYFDIDSFDLLDISYIGNDLVKVDYELYTDYNRPEDYDPVMGLLHSGLQSDFISITGLTEGQHSQNVYIGNDRGVFTLTFYWIHPQPDPFTEWTAKSFHFDIDESGALTIEPLAAVGTGYSAIGGTTGDPYCGTCGSGMRQVLGPLGNPLASDPIEQGYPLPNLSIRQQPGGGCNSCVGGAGGVASTQLDYQVYFQPQNAIFDGSFGPGVFSSYNSGGFAFEPEGEYPSARIFDVRLGIAVTFLDDDYGSTGGDGLLHDRLGYYKQAQILGGNSLETATGIEVTQHDGTRLVYEIWEYPSSDGGAEPWRDRNVRLQKIVDTNDREILISYPSGDTGIFSSVTHWNGDSIGASFQGTPSANLPAAGFTVCGHTFDFSYDANTGFLTDIDGPDGWYWSNTISTDPVAQTAVFTITDPNHGTREYHGAQDFMVFNNDIVSQPSAFLRLIMDDADNHILWILPDFDSPGTFMLSYGGNRLANYVLGEHVVYGKEWVIGDPEDGYDAFTVTDWEETYNWNFFDPATIGGQTPLDIERMLMLGAPLKGQDLYGNLYDFEYDSDFSLERRVYSDGTDEDFERNVNKQVTRYCDRLDRVTLYEYDNNGNLTKRSEGLLDAGGTGETPQAEFAEYLFSYDGNGFLTAEFDAEYSATTPDTHLTEYEYQNMRLHKKIEAADFGSGPRPETVYSYGPDGLISQIVAPGPDPVQTQTTQYEYNGWGALIKKTYNDQSTEKWIYADSGADEGRLVKYKDRVGTVTKYEYDSQARVIKKTVNFEHMDDSGGITPVSDPNLQHVTDYEYAPATRLVVRSTTDGKKSESYFGYRHRVVQSDVFPVVAQQSVVVNTNKTEFRRNRIFYTEDPYGRRVYNAYSQANQTELIRQVTVTVPYSEHSIVDSADVLALDRNVLPAANSHFLITDAIKDAEGQSIELIDPKGTITKHAFNSRGFEIWRKAAFGTPIEQQTEYEYDKNGLQLRVRTPRYFDASDPQAANMYTTYEYNGRNMLYRTLKAGTQVLSELSYYPDRSTAESKDAAGESWYTFYHPCCGRLLGRKNPLGHGSFSNTDPEGRVTHTSVVEDYDSHSSGSHAPTDSLTMSETTTRYDALGRPTFSTRWLTPLGFVDPESPPIAGLDSVPSANGITSQVYYDNNLSDGVGMESAGGITVHDFTNGSTFGISISDCLTKLAQPHTSGGADLTFTPGSAGTAVLRVNGAGEVSVSISDAAGRNVMNAALDPSTGNAVTWSCTRFDTITQLSIDGVGTSLHEVRQILPGGQVSKSFSDGAGRMLRSEDAEANMAEYSFDSLGNVVIQRDPNGVGTDIVYDVLGRQISQTSTWGDTTNVVYDKEGNVVEQTDAKSKTIFIEYDQFNRRKNVKDRLHTAGTPSITVYNYTLTGQLDSILDAEQKSTIYTYDEVGQKLSETYDDHVLGSNPGDAGYGIVTFEYDPAGRMFRRTDQLGDTVTANFDMAGRLLQRDYRTRVNSPAGAIADSDVFTHDGAGRVLTAASGRYANTVSMSYNEIGQLENESQTIGGQTYQSGYAYNSDGQLSQMTYPTGDVILRDYSDRGQLDQIKLNGTTIDTRTYDPGGRLDTIAYNNGVTTDYGYRENGTQKDNLISQIATTHPGGTTHTVGNYSYTWDANQNKSSESISGTMSNFGFSNSAYDDEDRLTQWNRTDGNQDQSWNLSLVGNWNSFTEEATTESRTFSDTHELLSITGGSNAGTLDYDPKGNLTQNSDGALYTWDFDNRMVSADTDADSVVDVDFAYDALGRRLRKGTTVFAYAGNQVVAEYVSGTAPGQPTETWVYGSYIDEPICKVGTGGTVYFSRNQQYSITAVTDSNGEVVERCGYDAYGQLSLFDGAENSIPTSAVGNSYYFTGRRMDAETGLYYFRARNYDSRLGRFIARDPLGYVDGMSMYRGYFAAGSIDPSGMDEISAIWNPATGQFDLYWINIGCFGGRFDPVLVGHIDNGSGYVQLTNGRWTTVDLVLDEGQGWNWTDWEHFGSDGSRTCPNNPSSCPLSDFINEKGVPHGLAAACFIRERQLDGANGETTGPQDLDRIVSACGIAEGLANELLIFYAAMPLEMAQMCRVASAVSKCSRATYSGIAPSCGRSARELSFEFAGRLARCNSRGYAKGRVCSAVVCKRTGNVYYGVSRGSPMEQPGHVCNFLTDRISSSAKIADWPFTNCAEFNAVNTALQNGARFDDLTCHTVQIGSRYVDGAPVISSKPMCGQCQQVLKGLNCTSQ